MIIIKGWYHLIALVQKLFFFVVYGPKIKIGKGTTWRRGFSVMKDNEAFIIIGKDCFFNNDCSINANHYIEIGGGSIFGENVKIYDHNHHFNQHKAIKLQGFSNGEVMIGDHCWIGSNVTILKGAKIGNDCVIGAGCIISGVVPDNSIVRPVQNTTIEKIRYKEDK